MSVALPSSLALANIGTGALITSADHNNNYGAVQVGVNGLIAMFTNAPTKGDLIVSQGGSNFDKLSVGTNGQVLAADSTQPLGVKWASIVALLTAGLGGDITAAATINVDHQVHRVSGATQIQQITANSATPTGGMIVTLISVGGAITYNSLANIFATGAGGTRAVPQHAAVTLVYDSTAGQWNVAGVGS
jgi:hypothetical protein